MSTHPYLAARLSAEHQAEIVKRAHNRRLRNEAVSAAKLAQPKIPSRVPRHWRWSYFARRTLGI
jgi:hypothetical protein